MMDIFTRGKPKVRPIQPQPLAAYRRTQSFVTGDPRHPASDTTVREAQQMMERDLSRTDWVRVRGHMLSSTGDAALLWSFFTVIKSEDMAMFELALSRIYQFLGHERSRELFRDMELDPRKRAYIELSGERP
jgi:hypothetical protein